MGLLRGLARVYRNSTAALLLLLIAPTPRPLLAGSARLRQYTLAWRTDKNRQGQLSQHHQDFRTLFAVASSGPKLGWGVTQQLAQMRELCAVNAPHNAVSRAHELTRHRIKLSANTPPNKGGGGKFTAQPHPHTQF